ncbi:MAG: PAS domain S-box protein [Candidatus Cyclobacteriaceae bacterium M2_1C_046]
MNRSRFRESENVIDQDVLHNLFDRNQDAVIITDLDLTILYSNQSASKSFSKTQKLKPGKNLILQFAELSSKIDNLTHLKNGLSTKFSVFIESNPYKFSASLMALSERDYFIFIITKEKNKAKKSVESIFKPLVQQSPIATAIFTPQGKPIYINRAYGELFSITSDFNDFVLENYNLFNDEQIVDSGLLPFIEKSISGETVEIPTILYNPAKSSVLSKAGIDQEKFVKGSIFPVKNDHQEVNEIVIVLNDVTFQKQAEQILTEAHLKFQMLNLNLPGAIYEYEKSPDGKKGKFIYMSQGCQDIFGIEPELVMRDEDTINGLLHPDDISSYRQTLAESEKYSTHWQWEGRIVVRGMVKWIEAKSSLRIQPDGRHISYGVLLDVTEKKNAEKQYQESEERLRLALQSAQINLWEWSDKSGKVFLNVNWAEKYGFSNEEAAKFDDWKKLVHPDDLSGVEERFSELLKGESKHFEAEYRVLCKNGDWSWILDKGRVVEVYDNGSCKKVVGTQVDINDRKISEAIIRKNEQLFTQLFENAPVGIVLLDEKHRVVQMNKGFEDLFGYSRKEIIGNALNKLIVPKELVNEAHEINVLTGAGKVGKLESARRNKDGELIPVIIYGVPVMLNKKTIGIYGIYVDISDRKKAEHELQIRNDELDNFVYKVSHDLRAPLSSILGLVNLAHLENNYDDPREYINLIGQRVRQLDSFISDVLSHSKNLKLEVSVAEIDFHQIICRCFKDLSYLPGAEGIKHQIEISGKTFYSDPWRVNEIFRNLISNAIKYMNKEEKDPFISISIKTNSRSSKIVFSDNGMGIDKSMQTRIFDMFYRATTSSEGSGIGLYIVKNAIEKLGGSISVLSEPLKGTTFELEIPNIKP